MTLTKEEMETTINYDESSPDADVVTYNKALQKRIEKRVGVAPYRNNGRGGRLYTIPKKMITIRIPRKLSPEQRQKLAERLRESRKQKSPNSLGNNTAIRKSQGEKVSKGKVINRQKKVPK